MPNPAVIALSKDVITKVATNISIDVNFHNVHLSKFFGVKKILVTYRMTGESAPTDMNDAVTWSSGEIPVKNEDGIDVYMMSPKKDTEVVRHGGQ